MNTAQNLNPAEVLVWRYGRILLTVGLALALLLLLAVSALAPNLILFVPLIPVLGIAGWLLFRNQTLNLAIVLACFPLVADFEEGLDITEVLYGLYYLSFLAHWYFTNVIILERRQVNSTTDRLAVFILVWVVLYVPISLLFGGDITGIRGELLAFTMLGFYFPIKSLVAHDKNGIRILFIVLLVIGIFILFRNIAQLKQLLSNATMAWQVTRKGRIATNEILLVVPSYAMLAWAIFSTSNRLKLIRYAALFGLVFGLVLTQSRGYWVAFALGLIVLFALLEHKSRVELVFVGLTGLTATVALVFAVFGETALLLVVGLFNRMLSLGTATSQDISLINRFLESSAVLSRIAENPIVGYGMGVPYSFHDVTISGTRTRAFIHNGYLSLWYRFGIVGLISICTFWLASIRTSILAARGGGNSWHRAGAMVSAAGLSSMLLSAMTSTPFYHNDLMLMFALMSGMAAGIAQSPRLNERGLSSTSAIV